MTAGKVQIDRRIDSAQQAALHQANVQLPNTQVTVIKACVRLRRSGSARARGPSA